MARKRQRRQAKPGDAQADATGPSSAATQEGGGPSKVGEVPAPARGRVRWIRLIVLIAVLAGLFSLKHFWWPPLFRNLAAEELRQGHIEEGLAWLEYVDWLVADDAATTLLRARAHRKLGEMDVVSKLLSQARRQGASAEAVRREEILAYAQSGQMSQAQPYLGQYLRDSDGDLDDVCEAFVIGYMRNQRFGDALSLLEAWTRDSPDLATPFLLRGKLFSFRDAFAEAEEDFRRAISLDPSLDEARLELALVLMEANRFDEAAPLLEDCLDSREFRTAAMVQLALCHSALGESERGLELLQQAHRESPNDRQALLELGRAQFENGDYEAAVVTLTDAVAMNPLDDEARFVLAQSLSLCGRQEEAEPHFEYVAEVRSALAEIDRLNNVILEDPTDVESLVAVGELYLKHLNPEEGVIRLLSALDLDPENETAHRLLYEHYSRLADRDAAYQALAEEHARYLQ